MATPTDSRAPAFYSRLETLPRAELEALQEQRLLTTLQRAWRESPLFRTTWSEAGLHPDQIKNFHDFQAKAPFFNQDSIRQFRDRYQNPCGGLIDLDNPHLSGMATTSGTTGDPTPMPMRFQFSTHETFIRDFWHIGMRPGDYMLLSVFTFRGGSSMILNGLKEAGVTPVYFNHSPAEIPRMIRALKQYRPTVISLMSSPLILGFEKYFEQSHEDPRAVFASVKGAVFGGEALSPRLKKMTREWGLELFETTALGDVGTGTECHRHDGFHAHEDRALVECLDPDSGAPVADGQMGELVVTALNDPLLSMVRFRTDDLVTLNREPCQCGRTHLRYYVHGRKGDQIIVQGRHVLPNDIRHLVENHHETASGLFQIVRRQKEMDVLTVRVGYNPARLQVSADALASRLADELQTSLNIPVNIELIADDELLKLGPPHKIPRVTKQ